MLCRRGSGKGCLQVDYRVIGNKVAEWADNSPFIFTLRGEVGPKDNRVTQTIMIDLSRLREGYSDDFIFHLKDHVLERSNQVVLNTVDREAGSLARLFRKLVDLKVFVRKISVIDEEFLLCTSSVKEKLTKGEILQLKMAFTSNPHSPIFSKGLAGSDFPTWEDKKGQYGRQLDRILAKALSQAASTYILDLCDTAYAAHRIDIGHYSFAHLSFAVFVRPESYRQIRVGDFWFDPEAKRYFIQIVRAKSGEHVPSKITYGLNDFVGTLVKKQRQHVIDTYGHLVAEEEIEKLALFPARQLESNGERWTHEYANRYHGMYETPGAFSYGYSRAIKKILMAKKNKSSEYTVGDSQRIVMDNQFTLGATVLRHTVGTQLAHYGASAHTIQAVLKHASDTVCKAYVDIAFHGLMEELSEALHPAFAEHLPGLLNFRAKGDPVIPEKLIRLEDLETGRIEEIGECGKDIACAYAPIVCYACYRFIPCWDADHSLNLNIVQREIEDMTKRGKPFQHMVDRARTAKHRILLVMNATDRYRDAMGLD